MSALAKQTDCKPHTGKKLTIEAKLCNIYTELNRATRDFRSQVFVYAAIYAITDITNLGGLNMKTNLHTDRTFRLVLTAMFAAVIAVASWISVPLPFTPVPINLATLAVTLTGALLGSRYGSLPVLIYLLLGAVGVPVFAGFTGGLGHIAGPTGGYIVGYLTSALICGMIIELVGKDEPKWWAVAIAALLGTLSCYILGTIWFIILTHNTLAASMTMCVIPFLPGEALKLVAAVVIVPVLKPVLDRMYGTRQSMA